MATRDPAAEAAFRDQVRENLPRNYLSHLAHGLLGTMLHYCWPPEWLHSLTIGARFDLWQPPS